MKGFFLDSLTLEELKLIKEIAPQGAASGKRYPESSMGYLNL
ncbi:hypothetical protein [Paenibacillus wynnii]|nr:hypothetical protein [Paenibacillus wynnii]